MATTTTATIGTGYQRPTRSSMPPCVRGYDDRSDYDRDRDGERNDRRRDDDDYDDDYNRKDNDVNGGAENAKDRVRRRRYGSIYNGADLMVKVQQVHRRRRHNIGGGRGRRRRRIRIGIGATA